MSPLDLHYTRDTQGCRGWRTDARFHSEATLFGSTSSLAALRWVQDELGKSPMEDFLEPVGAPAFRSYGPSFLLPLGPVVGTQAKLGQSFFLWSLVSTM